jgi:hypothetical protein
MIRGLGAEMQDVSRTPDPLFRPEPIAMRLSRTSPVRRTAFQPGVESAERRLLLTATVAADVLTYHSDNARTGQDLAETTLNPSNVNASNFGKLFSDPTDGAIYAQPLYMANVSIPGKGIHNVVIVATEHDSVYAFDADAPGPALWHISFLNPALGVTTVPAIQPWQDDLTPEVGITGTPVIDPSTGTLYVAAKTQLATSIGPRDVYSLHALNVATGAETLGGPVVIQPSVPGRGAGHVKGTVTFDAEFQLQRPALLLENGVVYVAFGSLGDHGPYHGWVVGYNASNLQQAAVFNTTPNSNDPTGNLGGIWMSGGGPAADLAGNVYLLAGSGSFNPGRGVGSYADSILKLTPTLKVADYYAPSNTSYLDKKDLDLGSGGGILVPTSPGSTSNLILGGGKLGTLFAINTAAMGHQTRKNPSAQLVQVSTQPIHSSPAYFHGSVYINPISDVLKQYQVINGKLIGPTAVAPDKPFNYPGAGLSISANGSSFGIVWSLENTGTHGVTGRAILHAYNAANVSQELYTSNQAGGRDQPGDAVKFAVPTVANGKVYVETQSGLVVYGLLP